MCKLLCLIYHILYYNHNNKLYYNHNTCRISLEDSQLIFISSLFSALDVDLSVSKKYPWSPLQCVLYTNILYKYTEHITSLWINQISKILLRNSLYLILRPSHLLPLILYSYKLIFVFITLHLYALYCLECYELNSVNILITHSCPLFRILEYLSSIDILYCITIKGLYLNLLFVILYCFLLN
jgi:hypothetical protein